jgi:hypothetical protein
MHWFSRIIYRDGARLRTLNDYRKALDNFPCPLIFTMASILKKGSEISLDFTSGVVLVLKPTQFPFAISPSEAMSTLKPKPIHLDLHNENGDILLRISFDPGTLGRYHKIFFNDRARKSLGGGWGVAQQVDVDKSYDGWKDSQFTISLHHYLTDSEFGRYQILLGKTTICHFDKRFPGQARQLTYTGNMSLGPDSWGITVYLISDLHPDEGRLLGTGR